MPDRLRSIWKQPDRWRIARQTAAVAMTVALAATACGSSDTASPSSVATPAPVPAVATETVPAPTSTAPTKTAPTSTPDSSPSPTPSTAPTPPPTSTPEPTATPPPPTPTPQPDGPCGVGPLALPDPNRPVYAASLSIDPPARTALGTVKVTFTPDLDIDDVIVRLWPNGPRPTANGVDMDVTRSTIDGQVIEPAVDADGRLVDPTLLQFVLDETHPAGQPLELELDVRLVVPAEGRSRISAADDYMRLGTALPLLPWEPGVGWATDPATALFAESVLSPVADYAVRIDVPDGYDVLASGQRDADGVWRVDAARDFAVTVGRFRIVTATALAPSPVEVTVGVHETLSDPEAAYLDKIVDSLESFSTRFGQYPWPSLTFSITPNLRGGIEFPTHIMQGPDTLGRTTSHEVGHMWFYSLVGNNQGADPWLDEGLASYAEFTYEATPANAWPIPAPGVGRATEPMTYWADRSDVYYRAVYSQTGFALMNLGARTDVDCALARYVADNAHDIATAADFVQAFEPGFPNVVDELTALGVVISADG